MQLYCIFTGYPILGVLMTMPLLFTQTQTLLQRKFRMTDVPSLTILGLTRGFCVLIMVTATVPGAPTSSGHELFPSHSQ